MVAYRGLFKAHLTELLRDTPHLDELFTPRPDEHKAPILLDGILRSATTGHGGKPQDYLNSVAGLHLCEQHAKVPKWS